MSDLTHRMYHKASAFGFWSYDAEGEQAFTDGILVGIHMAQTNRPLANEYVEDEAGEHPERKSELAYWIIDLQKPSWLPKSLKEMS